LTHDRIVRRGIVTRLLHVEGQPIVVQARQRRDGSVIFHSVLTAGAHRSEVAIEDKIIREVIERLKAGFVRAVRSTKIPEAHDLYLRGRAELRKRPGSPAPECPGPPSGTPSTAMRSALTAAKTAGSVAFTV
jgi:hypothetical protein